MNPHQRQYPGSESLLQSIISPPEDTRQRLLWAGLAVFSQYNYEGATTRMIAERAEVNLAAIPYHFGGKEGLYRATILFVVEQVKAQIDPMIQNLREKFETSQADKETCIADLAQFLSDFISKIISLNIPRSWLRLGFSEDNAPVQAFDLIYEGIIYPIHELTGTMLAFILDLSPQSEETILRTHAIIGQAIAFHLSREAVLRRLNQPELTEAQIQLIRRIIQEHVTAILGKGTLLAAPQLEGNCP